VTGKACTGTKIGSEPRSRYKSCAHELHDYYTSSDRKREADQLVSLEDRSVMMDDAHVAKLHDLFYRKKEDV
jgi:hypothetical protein